MAWNPLSADKRKIQPPRVSCRECTLGLHLQFILAPVSLVAGEGWLWLDSMLGSGLPAQSVCF